MGNRKRKGMSYVKRVADINQVYDFYARTGLSNREIWRRYIYPRFGISERTLYNLINATSACVCESRQELAAEGFLFPELSSSENESRDLNYWRKKE